MHSFYRLLIEQFSQYEPDLTKFAGDGYIAIWETTHEDRHIAIETCLKGVMNLEVMWQRVRVRSRFIHGAPEHIGAGVSFGLASTQSGKPRQ